MRLGRFSHQTGYTNTRRAHNSNSRGGDISGDVNTTAVGNEKSQDAATPDQSTNHRDQSFKQPSSRLHQQDMHSLAHREYIDRANTPDSLQENTIVVALSAASTNPSTTAATAIEPTTRHSGSQSETTTYSQPYSQLWVRIPYPLVSFIPLKPEIVQPQTLESGSRPDDTPSNQNSDKHLTYQYIAPPGWFNLGATQMRNMTVATLDEASNVMWEGSRARKVPQPSEFF